MKLLPSHVICVFVGAAAVVVVEEAVLDEGEEVEVEVAGGQEAVAGWVE